MRTTIKKRKYKRPRRKTSKKMRLRQKGLLWGELCGGAITQSPDGIVVSWIDDYYPKGDIIGEGGWGKVIVANSNDYSDKVAKIVLKTNTYEKNCDEMVQEYNILNKINKLAPAQQKNNISSPEAYNFNYILRSTKTNEIIIQNSARKVDKHNGCILIMQRIFEPIKKQLKTIVKPEHNGNYMKNHGTNAPYHLFLGRISSASVLRGAWDPDPFVQILPLSVLEGVTKWEIITTDSNARILLDGMDKRYAARQYVVSNYIVNENSMPMKWGSNICSLFWNAWYKEHLCLDDCEFVLGNRHATTASKTPHCFIIDFNRAYVSDNMDHFLKSLAINMDIYVFGYTSKDNSWGGFTPNPMISPEFAITCWNNVYKDIDDERERSRYKEFMVKYLDGINAYLRKYYKPLSFGIDLTKIKTFLHKDIFILDTYTLFDTTMFQDVNINDRCILFCALWKRCYILEMIYAFLLEYDERYHSHSDILIQLERVVDQTLHTKTTEEQFTDIIQNILELWGLEYKNAENIKISIQKPRVELESEYIENISLFGDDE